MNKKKLILVFIIVILALTVGCSVNTVNIIKAQKGEIDLSNFDFSKDKNVTLAGQWKLYWNEFIDPTEVNNGSNFSYIDLPNSWIIKKIKDQTLKSQGYGTLVLNLKLNSKYKRYAIKTIYLTSAFKIYVNGKLIATNGEIGKDEKNMIPQWKPVIGTFEVPSEGNIELVIHFSNFNHRRMVMKNIFIGTDTSIEQYKNIRTFFDLFAFGCIFTMGCYHLILYFARKNDRISFYFSLVCLLFATRTILVGERFIYSLFPNLNWNIFMKMAYLTVYLTFPFIANFIMEILGKSRNNVFLKAIHYIAFLFSLIVIFFKPNQFDRTLVLYEAAAVIIMIYLMITIIKSIRKKQKEAIILLLGFSIFGATLLSDLLYENNIIQTNSSTVLGVIFLILSQSFMLAAKFSNSFKQIEKLALENEEINKQLEIYSEDLEELIELRTNELRIANEKLESVNLELKKLVITDGMTNLYNRRYFMIQLETSFNDALKNNKSLSLIMFDIDFFKSINDTYGHDIGDMVICEISRISKLIFNENAVVARLGGEEFIVLLLEADKNIAFQYGEKLRKTVEELNFKPCESIKVNFTISVGVSSLNSKIHSMMALLKNVDIALYKAKNNGRNRVET